jgi:hypothetical protein
MKLIFISLIFCLPALMNGQYVEPKFGKIEIADLSMTKYDKDTTAGALLLFNNGNTEFILNDEQKFQFIYERHCQIKLFKKSSFPIADISIRLYKSGSSKEYLKNLKAITYNLIDGKIVKTKLDNDNIYMSEGKNYTDVKFAFPEIKEGSIIEYSYSITSDFLYNLRGWNFQYNYPARWSQYTYNIPEYFSYREATKGYLQFDVHKKETVNTFFTIVTKPDVEPTSGGNREATERELLKAETVKTTLAIKDVPAFISEPNIDCEDNYIQSIEFELSSIQFPNQLRKDYTQSWESVNTQMKEDDDFGDLLKANGFIKDTVTLVCNNKSTDMEKAISLYNYVQKRMNWNGEYRIWATKGLKKPFLNGTGSSSEINMLLTLMLQTAGLKANPVMFSTRDNGVAITFYPTITKFNSILSRVEIDGKPILLDAVSKYCKFGVLPANDINGKGRVVNDLTGDWVNLDAREKYIENKKYNLEIRSDGKLAGLITDNYDGYAGIYYRNRLNSEKNSDDYYRKLQETTKGLTISKYSISDRYINSNPVTDTLNVEVTDRAQLIGDKILFNPLLFETIEKNRYTLEDRKYPVDYNYPISEAYTFNYTLPAGFKVESLPQSISLKLPDNSISITYNIQNIDNRIIIEYKRDVNKILFLPGEYNKLKNLYDQLVKKHAEQIILKKSI